MFDHTLPKAGDFMAGYRYMRNEQAGDMLLGSNPVALDTVNANGCEGRECAVTPDFMAMSMHMLDLMVRADRLADLDADAAVDGHGDDHERRIPTYRSQAVMAAMVAMPDTDTKRAVSVILARMPCSKPSTIPTII